MRGEGMGRREHTVIENVSACTASQLRATLLPKTLSVVHSYCVLHILCTPKHLHPHAMHTDVQCYKHKSTHAYIPSLVLFSNCLTALLHDCRDCIKSR